MTERTRIAPKYQEPLQPGWWKTGAGWRALLGSHRIDRRAKPVVIAFIVAVFLLVNWVAGWAFWRLLAIVGGLLIVAVLVFSPVDIAEAVPLRPLELGWWKTVDGWRRLPNADMDEPGVGMFFLILALILAAIAIAMSGRRAIPWAVLWVPTLGRGVAPQRIRRYVLAAALVGFVIAVQFFRD